LIFNIIMTLEKKGTIVDCKSLGGKPWGKTSNKSDETEFKCIFKNHNAIKKIKTMTEFVDIEKNKISRIIATASYYKRTFAFNTTETTLNRWLKVMNMMSISKNEKNVGDQKVFIYKLNQL